MAEICIENALNKFERRQYRKNASVSAE